MPLKVCVGLTKKEGQPNYGSVGANCHVEVELDSSLLRDDLESFQRHVKNAYVACSQAVNDELARQTGPAALRHSTGNGHGQGTRRNGNESTAATANGSAPSQKQLDYIQQLARQIRGLDAARLETLSDRMFDKPVAQFTSFQASALIDQLKAIKSGQLNLAEALGSEASV